MTYITRGRKVIEIENTPAMLAWARGALTASGYTPEMWKEEVRFLIKEPWVDTSPFLPPPVTTPPPPAKWWEFLPPAPARSPIRARVHTITYKDRTRTVTHSTKQPGDVIDYWGRHEDGWLVVYQGTTLTVWAWGDDFEKA